MGLMFAAACGTSPTSAASSPGSPTQPAANHSSAASPKSSSPATAGTMVDVGGYLYWLAVSPGGPQTSIDLNVGGISLPSKCAFPCNTIPVAPPGEVYVYVP